MAILRFNLTENKMKISKFIPIAILCIIYSCKGETIDISNLIAERDSIKEVNSQQKQELESLNTFVSAISESLDSINMQENIIRAGGIEGKVFTKEDMKRNLSDLAAMLARHRIRIAQLEDSLKVRGTGAENLHNIVSYLNEQLETKEKTIAQLRSELNNKNTNIAKLQTQIASLNEDVERLDKKTKMQKEVLVTQSEMMNECYMKIGTKKQLKQAGILDGKKLNAAGLTPDRFVRVDIRNLTELNIKSKKPKILTTMPQGAYSLIRNSDGTTTLTINDPTAFWSISNYLVISLD